MGKKYIIFDFDGTLVNTNDVIVGSWQATYEHYLGRQVSRTEIEQTFGETLRGTIQRKIPDAPVDEVVDYYRAWQESHKEQMVHVYDGIKELLGELRSRGCIIGVGTSRTTYSLINYLRQFGMEDAIDEIVTMDDVTGHKPDPDTALAVLAKMAGLGDWRAIPEEVLDEAIMLGDSRYDIGCSYNAGIDSVLTTWGRPIGEEEIATWDWRPTYVIDRPEELLDIV